MNLCNNAGKEAPSKEALVKEETAAQKSLPRRHQSSRHQPRGAECLSSMVPTVQPSGSLSPIQSRGGVRARSVRWKTPLMPLTLQPYPLGIEFANVVTHESK